MNTIVPRCLNEIPCGFERTLCDGLQLCSLVTSTVRGQLFRRDLLTVFTKDS